MCLRIDLYERIKGNRCGIAYIEEKEEKKKKSMGDKQLNK